MGLLEGKTVLITGAARGIGRAIALCFAREGADLALTVRSMNENAVSLKEEIEAMGRRVVLYVADARSFEDAHQITQAMASDFSRIDVLVNNAGITRDSLLLRMDEQSWDEVIDNDLKSAFNYTHAVLPVMSRQKSGSIINISSIVGESGNPGQANYAAAKAGTIGLAKSIAKEMGSRGIRSNCVAPGFIATDMTDALPDAVRQSLLAGIPMKRAGTPEEVASVALFLASDLSSYVNGQVIDCCGGMYC